MPTYASFDGFRVELRSRDHAPVGIRDLRIMRGTITRRVLAEVVAWASGQTDELMAEWRRLNERD